MAHKYDPYINFAGFERLQEELGRIFNFDEILRDDVTTGEATTWKPSVDIREDDSRFVIYADIPGVDPEKISVSLQRGVLTVSGERDIERKSSDKYKRVERRAGNFQRQFPLPDTADESSVSASCRHGVLTITVDKKVAETARTIKVVNQDAQ